MNASWPQKPSSLETQDYNEAMDVEDPSEQFADADQLEELIVDVRTDMLPLELSKAAQIYKQSSQNYAKCNMTQKESWSWL